MEGPIKVGVEVPPNYLNMYPNREHPPGTDPHLLETAPNDSHKSTHHQCHILLISIDGFGDLPANQSLLGNTDPNHNNNIDQSILQSRTQFTAQHSLPLPPKSPLSLYRLPNLSRLRQSAYGLLDPVAPGLACGSDTAHLSLLGNNPNKVYRGRGALEGVGGGIVMPNGCIAFISCLGEFAFQSPQGRDYLSPLSMEYVDGSGIGINTGNNNHNSIINNNILNNNVNLGGNTIMNPPPIQINPHTLPPLLTPLAASSSSSSSSTNQFWNYRQNTIPNHRRHPSSQQFEQYGTQAITPQLRNNFLPISMPICNNRKLKETEKACIILCNELDNVILQHDGLVRINNIVYDVSHDDQMTWAYFLTTCRKELKLQLDSLKLRGTSSSILNKIKHFYEQLDLIPPPIPSITYIPHQQSVVDHIELQSLFLKPPKTPAQQEALLQRLDSTSSFHVSIRNTDNNNSNSNNNNNNNNSIHVPKLTPQQLTQSVHHSIQILQFIHTHVFHYLRH